MQPRLRALFFDFDGVIVGSTQPKKEAFRILFNEYSEEVIEKVLEYHRQHGGISRVEKIAYAHKHFIGSPLSETALKRWANRYSDLVVQKVIDAHWIDGAIEYLQEAKKTDMKIFVVSGTPEPELQYIIVQKGIDNIFHEQLGSPVKKPIHIRNLLEKYHLAPAECVFIGDAFTDYDAAKETDLHFIGIQGEIEFPQNTIVLKDCTVLQDTIDTLFP